MLSRLLESGPCCRNATRRSIWGPPAVVLPEQGRVSHGKGAHFLLSRLVESGPCCRIATRRSIWELSAVRLPEQGRVSHGRGSHFLLSLPDVVQKASALAYCWANLASICSIDMCAQPGCLDRTAVAPCCI